MTEETKELLEKNYRRLHKLLKLEFKRRERQQEIERLLKENGEILEFAKRDNNF